MQVFQVTSAAQQAVPAGNYQYLHIYNNSDSTVYLSYDGPAVTVAAGMPLVAAGMIRLENNTLKAVFVNGLSVIHNTSGNKEIRIQGA